MDKDVVSADDWLNVDRPIVIDADADEDVTLSTQGHQQNTRTNDNASINMEHVDPSIMALLTPNNLGKGGGWKKTQMGGASPAETGPLSSNSSLNNGSGCQSRRTTPTASSIPRLRSSMIHESPNSPGSTSSQSGDTTPKTSSFITPFSNAIRRRVVSPSPLSPTPEIPTRIPVNTRISSPFGRSSFSAAALGASSPPSTPSSSVVNLGANARVPSLPARLQPTSSGSSSGLRSGEPRATPNPPSRSPSPSTTPRHSPHALQPAFVSTASSSATAASSSSGLVSTTAPTTPGTPNSVSRHSHDSYGMGHYGALGLNASMHAPSISRQNSESSSIFWRQRAAMLGHGHGSEFFYEDAIKSAGSGGGGGNYGRGSLDSSRRPSEPVLPRRPSSGGGSGGGRVRGQVKVANSESQILATSTPFRRSHESGGGGIGVDVRPRTLSSDTTATSPGSPPLVRGGRSEAGDSAVSPSSPLGRRVEDDHRSISPKPKAAGGLRPVFSAPFRSRKRSMSVQEPHQSVRSLLGKRQDGGGVLQHHRLNGASRSNSSLGGRLSTRGGRERQVSEDGDESRRPPQHDWLGPRSVKALRAAGLLNDDRDRDMDSREQDKYALTTVTRSSRERSGSVATSVVSGGSGSGKASLSGLGRFMPSAAARSSSASEYSPQNGRTQSRMAFSDVGGSGPGRRESGTFSHQYLMHSPTLTISTASGSRDRDTPRSAASTAPTSVSSTSLVYRERERERDEIRDLKEKHATETGALLGALSDSQRTTRMLREENIDLRERLERMGDSEGENEELRREVRGLRRELNELKIQLLTASGGRGSRNGWLGAGRRSGVTTPVSEERETWLPPRSSMSDTEDTEVFPPKAKDVFRPLSAWSRQEAPPLSPSPPSLFSAPDTPASPETPRRHRRCPSDTSSIFPVLPSNMSMLMHEDNGLLGDQGSSHDGSSTAFDSACREDSSGSTVIIANKNGTDSDAGSSSSKPVPFRKGAVHNNGISNSTPVANRGGARTSVTPTSVSVSPTTANFSIMTGSPGSLFLRPEHEVHLGDMETFSLDFGSRMDEVGDLVEDW